MQQVDFWEFDISLPSLAYCQKEKGLIVYAFVIMSNHIHLIAAAKEGSKGLSAIIGDLKKHKYQLIIRLKFQGDYFFDCFPQNFLE